MSQPDVIVLRIDTIEQALRDEGLVMRDWR